MLRVPFIKQCYLVELMDMSYWLYGLLMEEHTSEICMVLTLLAFCRVFKDLAFPIRIQARLLDEPCLI